MTFLMVLAAFALLAFLAPAYGSDSRDLSGPEHARDKFWMYR